MSDVIDEIIKEADRIEESTKFTHVQHFIVASYWRQAHYWLGGLATIGASASTITIFSGRPDLDWIAGAMGAGVSILAGLLTFLNPKDAAQAHHTKGIGYLRLREDARVLKNIRSKITENDNDLADQLTDLLDRKQNIGLVSPATPTGHFYRKAKKQIESGQTAHAADD